MGFGSPSDAPKQPHHSSIEDDGTLRTDSDANNTDALCYLKKNTSTDQLQPVLLPSPSPEGEQLSAESSDTTAGPLSSSACGTSTGTGSLGSEFPYAQIGILAIVLLNESLCSTMLMPFIGLYVAHLLGTTPEAAGYASGVLIGVFQLGQVVSGRAWGGLSDEYGRKPALIGGLLLSGVVMLFFGLTSSFYVCVALRLAHGLCNGNILVAKAMIPEAVPPEHEAKGYAVVSLTWGIGSLMGPAIGGILYDPTRHAGLGLDPNGLFGQRPALLPAVVIAIYSIVATLLAQIFLRETNVHAAKQMPSVSAVLSGMRSKARQCLLRLVGGGSAPHSSSSLRRSAVLDFPSEEAGDTNLAVFEEEEDEEGCTRLSTRRRHERERLTMTTTVGGGAARDGDEVVIEAAPAPPSSTTTSAPAASPYGYKEAFANPLVRRVCIMYALIASGDIFFGEVGPLWAVSSYGAGGLGLGPEVVGVMIVVTGIPCIAANASMGAAMRRAKGPIPLWAAAVWAWIISLVLLPFAARTAFSHNASASTSSSSSSDSASIIAAIVAAVLLCVRQGGSSWAFGTVFMLIGRSAPAGRIGAINGVAQSVGSAVRCVAPIIFAPLYAWSIAPAERGDNPRPFPLDHNLCFLLSGVILVVAARMAQPLRHHPAAALVAAAPLSSREDGGHPAEGHSKTRALKSSSAGAGSDIHSHNHHDDYTIQIEYDSNACSRSLVAATAAPVGGGSFSSLRSPAAAGGMTALSSTTITTTTPVTTATLPLGDGGTLHVSPSSHLPQNHHHDHHPSPAGVVMASSWAASVSSAFGHTPTLGSATTSPALLFAPTAAPPTPAPSPAARPRSHGGSLQRAVSGGCRGGGGRGGGGLPPLLLLPPSQSVHTDTTLT